MSKAADRIIASGVIGMSSPNQPLEGSSEPPAIMQTYRGLVQFTRPEEATEEQPDEAPQPVPIEEGQIVSGVVAAGISLNSIRPLQPQPTTWDVFSSPTALINGDLAAFRLPDPEPTINDYIAGETGVEYDEQCLLSTESPTRQRIPGAGEHNSYSIEARAIVPVDAALNVETLIRAAAAASGVDVVMFDWVGPFRGMDARVGRLRIAPHDVWQDGERVGTYEHTSDIDDGLPTVEFEAPDVGELSSSSSGYAIPAVLDLLFTSVSGAPWKLYVMRSR